MHKRIFTIIAILLTVLSCQANDKVTIRVTFKDEMDKRRMFEKELSIDTSELVFVRANTEKLEGIEKLRNLKKLSIGLGSFYTDYSFLKYLDKLEILDMNFCYIDNLDFLKSLKNLEVLILDKSRIYKNEIDLVNNKKFKYINLWGIAYSPRKEIPGEPFILNLQNVPESLEYFDLDGNVYIILSRELLTKIENVPYVILGKEGKFYKKDKTVYNSYVENMDFIGSHHNFIFKSQDEVLPEKYRTGILHFDDKALNKFKEFWKTMKEVPFED